jgi:Uncharacterized conserved protein
MSTLDEVRTQIDALEPADQEELLASLAGQLRTVTPDASFPAIVSTPHVCGGDARIVRTRIPVWSIERMRQLGGSVEVILSNYPSLRKDHLTQAWAYADKHRHEIEWQIRENEQED